MSLTSSPKAVSSYTGLPEGWQIRISKSHNTEYFYNPTTQESTWNAPEGSNEDLLNSYVAKGLHNPAEVRVNHLLLKHKDSRRPASWKSESITRTKEEAIEELKEWERKIKSGEVKLSDVATTESDCSSHSKGGDLGFFGRRQMQPSFEKASFALQVGEFSPIVETDSGVHLIERTG
ncbi:unnamed protein product [Kuraishia capsulata CBS 1993]|uniref:Peptidyl-prolyl cis-trans isomerase n=1 Tax=Kuraishia capsulata CBS 1993 TaxID=1382522 RepID=W6MS82_9ASCO|nr:uncharacterized protein KUCA_T00005644001 [Kuraishia capsulata CBS 1993]CDK29651.1 unnamed protein product [Kuraishia capsulata CBS 1993]